jgi:prephenate dehydrogenase
MIKRLAIVGVGLIGSSLALALREAGFVSHVTGCGRSEVNLKKGVELGVLDDYDLTPADAVAGADVVLLAVPLGAMREVLQAVKPGLARNAIVTDVGSAKGSVVADARSVLGEGFRRFVAGHPIAGTERSGVEAGFAELYRKRKVILTPDDDNDADAIELVSAMWEAAGANVELMGVEHHDRILAATSHLPHMLAFSLVSHLSGMSNQDEIFNYAAGGFRDFTRIASSDPVMWRDICLANGGALIELIEGYQAQLDEIRQAIHDRDAEHLYELFRDAKHTRDQLRNLE